jgi:hypothetical protein
MSNHCRRLSHDYGDEMNPRALVTVAALPTAVLAAAVIAGA